MRLLLRSLMVGLFLAGGYTFAQQQVYFSVDMNGEDIGVNDTVSIAGNLQVAAGFANDWTPGQIVMKDADGDGIYMDTLTLPAGSYEYKFTYLKAGAATWETPPGACTNSGGNRAVTVVAADTTLNTVCFNTCDASCPSGSGMVTFQVDVRNETFKPDSVSISGSLQMAAGFASNWTPGLTLMDDADGDSVYSITLTLPAGNYEYKFTLTDTSGSNVWEPFPGGNRQISVTDGLDTTLNANCFGTSFEVCPQDLPPINVTFRVNMANEFVSDSASSSEVASRTLSGRKTKSSWKTLTETKCMRLRFLSSQTSTSISTSTAPTEILPQTSFLKLATSWLADVDWAALVTTGPWS